VARRGKQPLEPRQARSRVLADAVLEASERVIENVGWSKTRVAEIAKVAGVSVGSLYRYFPGRDVLLRALIDRALRGDHAAFSAAVQKAQGETPEQSLEAFMDALLDDPRVTAPQLMRQLVDVLDAAGRVDTVQRLFDAMVVEFAEQMAKQHPELGPLAVVKRRSHMLFWGLRGAFVARVRVENPFDMQAFREDAMHMSRAMLIRSEAPAKR